MKDNELFLKPINKLLDERFFIPAYQRGYRWTERQVKDLLNDVLEFSQKDIKSKNEFYCLQPIVIKKIDGQWEVIDGQQRLTTIFLILSIFNERLAEDYREEIFSMEYETRPGSREYLESLDEEESDKNIDYWHIYNAYITIKDWVKEHTNLVNDIESAFLNKVQVIWYEILEKSDPIDIFTRLNIGKIPLTNSELVKALFLRTGKPDEVEASIQQLKIAQEWDLIECKLQADDFWYFIINKDMYSNRIEYILELMAKDLENQIDNNSDVQADDPYYTFLVFHRKIGEIKDKPEDLWLEVKKYFMTFEEWFNDRYFFHVIGFLINEGVAISDILQKSREADTKNQFKSELKKLALKVVLGKNYIEQEDEALDDLLRSHIKDLEYGRDSNKVRTLLLLFNILSVIQNETSNLRFQFDSFKNEQWDIEHVRSVKSGEPGRPDEQQFWLGDVYSYFTGGDDYKTLPGDLNADEKAICCNIQELLNAEKYDKSEFHDLYMDILKYCGEDTEEETDNSIGNLALLDAGTNRSYKNAVFPVKRDRIISLDKTGTFVPMCTKNVFLKYYSEKVNKMLFWEKTDRENYQDMIVNTVMVFFPTAPEGESNVK